MKNRTSLTMVISLLVCILTTGAFAQTNPSVLKPEDSTLEARPSDLQPAQVGNANGQCAYKVVPGDKVYLQIKSVKLRSDNLPLYPYFNIYGKSGEDWERITQTWSQDGNQICEKVQNPANFQFYIDNAYQECYIDVHSKWYTSDQLVAKGFSFNVEDLLKWADDPQNNGKTYKLEISNGNTIELKFVVIKNDRYYYFEIISYKITEIDNEYKKYLYEEYQTWLLTKQESVEDKVLYYYKGDKVFSPATANTQDYADIAQNRYDKEQRELLFSCTEDNNVKFTFSFNGKEYILDAVELTTNEVVKQLNDCMQKYPDDYTKWVVKCISKENSEIELIFAGLNILPEDSDIDTLFNNVVIEKSINPSSTNKISKKQKKHSKKSKCPYKVTNDDKVFFQIPKIILRPDNLPLDPYFCLYSINEGKETYITKTSSHTGNQVNCKVERSSYYQIYFDNTQMNYRLDVLSNLSRQVVAKGSTFNISELIKWTKHPYNRGRTFYLQISNGNIIGLKNIDIRQDRYYYYEIVSYKITKIDKSFAKFVLDTYNSYEPRLKFNGVDYFPEAIAINSNSIPILSFNKKKSDILLSCKPNRIYTFSVENNHGTIDSIELSSDDIVKQLKNCMQKYPDDYKKWVVKCVSKQNSEIELNFAGIRRIYSVTTISVPQVHSKQQILRYAEKGYAPWTRVYIQQNGLPCGLNCEYARAGRRAWNCDVPDDKYNRFEIREGVKARYSLQIKDADTWFYEIALIEFSGIRDLDFAKGIIYEKLDSMSNDDRRSTIQFEEVTE